MQFFIHFNKKGVVLHEEGIKPPYLNSLIKSINMTQITGTRNIQDNFMEYEIDGQDIFLTIGKKDELKKLISKYRKTNDKADTETVADSIKNDELNFGENHQSKAASIVSSIKKGEFRRTFGIFKGHISLDELKHKIIEHLVNKNVDPGICQIITSDVMKQLKDDNLTMVSESLFKMKIKNTLAKILPKFDHSSFIEKIRSHTGVYSICFLGVNGVGKSTSLAKIACWLIQNKLKVYIAACDTFRAGAIEQLKVHVNRFKASGNEVGFFESGYSKDDSSVAKYAIKRAEKENYDVILIDTAGRMHNKEHLMVSLTKLIKNNNPDHIVFVGEALSGGDTLNHIKEFNNRIFEAGHGRKIDSIILTKIDAVDDRIGQVVNFTFSASSPIMFLGTGQSNVDLQILDPELASDILTS